MFTKENIVMFLRVSLALQQIIFQGQSSRPKQVKFSGQNEVYDGPPKNQIVFFLDEGTIKFRHVNFLMLIQKSK